jgi:hypothetical protein
MTADTAAKKGLGTVHRRHHKNAPVGSILSHIISPQTTSKEASSLFKKI